jgi:hypothetical protein
MNAEDWHMTEFHWILAGFYRSYDTWRSVTIQENPSGSLFSTQTADCRKANRFLIKYDRL